MLALCDTSQVRMDYHRERIQRDYGYPEVRTYLAADFDRMLDEQKPDVVLISTVDAFHHEYILRATAKGFDVATEKPITVDDEKCRALLASPDVRRQHVRVIFNVRWTALATKMKEVIASGRIGAVKQIHYEYMINLPHGGLYMGRWHSGKANSGGLLVHKATHHFDLANWLVDSIPAEVFAFGSLAYFGRENALRRGEKAWTGYDRYTDKAASDDPFRQDLHANETLKGLYLNAEKETGYIYDKNVFRDGIDIEDTLCVTARYRSGVILNYSLNAYAPFGGYRMSVTGDKGRLEGQEISAVSAPDAGLVEPCSKLVCLPLFGPGEEIDVQVMEGEHGGSDPLLQEQIYSLDPPADPWGRNAGYEQGIASAILGIAGNRSLATGQKVLVNDLVTLRPEAIRLSELK